MMVGVEKLVNWQDEERLFINRDGKLCTRGESSEFGSKPLWEDSDDRGMDSRIEKTAYHIYSDGMIGSTVYEYIYGKCFGVEFIVLTPLNYYTNSQSFCTTIDLKDGKAVKISKPIGTTLNIQEVGLTDEVFDLITIAIKDMYRFNIKFKTDLYSDDIKILMDIAKTKRYGVQMFEDDLNTWLKRELKNGEE